MAGKNGKRPPLVAERRYSEALVPQKRRLGGVDLWRLQALARQDLLREAICTGTRIQLRSILLTSGTTIAGLLPLLSERSPQAQVLIHLAVSIVFGLMASTVLVLIVVPSLYVISPILL